MPTVNVEKVFLIHYKWLNRCALNVDSFPNYLVKQPHFEKDCSHN